MRVEKILARLTAGGVGVEIIGRGGAGGLTRDEIAAALAGLDRIAALYASVMFLHDRGAMGELIERVAQIVDRRWWADPEQAAGLTLLALADVTAPNYCDACKGGGGFQILDEWRTCPKCAGAGKLAISVRQSATVAGFRVSTWHKHAAELENILSEIRAIFYDAGRRVRTHVKQQIDDNYK